ASCACCASRKSGARRYSRRKGKRWCDLPVRGEPVEPRTRCYIRPSTGSGRTEEVGMTRKLGSGKLVIATHNAGKLKEIAALMAPYGVDCISAGSLGLPEPAETGKTFIENALLKARAAAEASGLTALADDSGLSVAALDGRPGVYTADWAERQWFEGSPGRDWYMAMGKVEGLLQAKGADVARDAWFSCTL